MEEKDNVLDLVVQMKNIVSESEGDAEKVLKGNKTAGIRLRKRMQEVKQLAQTIRTGVQEMKKEEA